MIQLLEDRALSGPGKMRPKGHRLPGPVMVCPELAGVAENLLLGLTCDKCIWHRQLDRAENGKLVMVAEKCAKSDSVLPEEGTCVEWAKERYFFGHP